MTRSTPGAGMSVRTRVIVYLVALTTAALTVAGATAYGIQRASILATLDDDLTVRTEDFLSVARAESEGAATFSSTDDLLREGVRRASLTRTEGVIALVDGEARYVPSTDDRVRLEDDLDFLAEAWSHAGDEIVLRSASTPVTTYRYTVVPIVDGGDAVDGALVLAVDRAAALEALESTFVSYALVSLVAVGAIAAIAYVTVGRLLRPIALLDATARRISEQDLGDRIPIVGNDDLAHLSATVNAMLDRLERAFADQRELLDDASHELRTPLTIVRNRLELLEPRDAEAVEDARADLLEEVEAMSRLVDDLVTLAKADRPEFLQREAVSLAELAEATFQRARGLGERAWVLAPGPDVIVVVDPQRITQAWLQLAANAVKFSEPGSTVTLGADVADGWARAWVRDEGRGISPANLERVRDRFFRVDPTAEGAGLGLTIVSAIAAAHGGMLDVQSVEGEGSTFTVVVPAGTAS